MKKKLFSRLMRGQRLTYLDIGARDLGMHFFKDVSGLIDFVGSEPEEEEAKRLMSSTPHPWRSVFLSNKGLSDKGGQGVLWITPNPGSSSTKKPLESYSIRYRRPGAYTSSKKQVIQTETIEELIIRSDARGGLALKLDIEGSELEVLLGLDESIGRVLLVKTEVSFQKIRESQSMPAEILLFMEDAGFDLVEISAIDDLRRTGDKSTFPSKNLTLHHYPIYSKGDVGTAEFMFLRRVGTVPPDLLRVFAAVCVELEQYDKASVLYEFLDNDITKSLMKLSRASYGRKIYRAVLKNGFDSLTLILRSLRWW